MWYGKDNKLELANNNFVTQWDLQDYIENTNRMQIVVIWALNKNFLS